MTDDTPLPDISEEALTALCEQLSARIALPVRGQPADRIARAFDLAQETAAEAAHVIEALAHSRDEYKRWYETAQERLETSRSMLEAAAREGVLGHALSEVERLEADNKRLAGQVEALRRAAEQAKEWFTEYGDGHNAKGAAEKAIRNYDRAAYLASELAATAPEDSA